MRKINPMVKGALQALHANALPLIDARSRIENDLARRIGDDGLARYSQQFQHNSRIAPEKLRAGRPTLELAS